MAKTKRKAEVQEDTCIECGCTESHACPPDGLFHESPCSWIVVDRRKHVGVCTRCPGAMKRWDKGDRAVKQVTTAQKRKAA